MKQQKVSLVRYPASLGKEDVYFVEKTFNLSEPKSGDIISEEVRQRLIDNRHVEVETKAKK